MFHIRGVRQAAAAGRCLKKFQVLPDIVYTSLLQRSKDTYRIAMDAAGFDPHSITEINSWRLNERYIFINTFLCT